MKLEIPGISEPIRPGKLLCIGRNYAAHAAEMKSEVPTSPMVFLKPSTALLASGSTVVIPRQSEEVHHEVELVVAVGTGGRHISAASAIEHVAAYAVGIDFTARDLQAAAKKKSHPWSVSKGFDTFAPVGQFVAAGEVGDPGDLAISMAINGKVVQEGSTADMIFDVATLVAYCSSIFTLEAGDLIFTGTPEGVGPVHSGDEIRAVVSGLPELTVSVAAEL